MIEIPERLTVGSGVMMTTKTPEGMTVDGRVEMTIKAIFKK
jgi:hypothetical protein